MVDRTPCNRRCSFGIISSYLVNGSTHWQKKTGTRLLSAIETASADCQNSCIGCGFFRTVVAGLGV